VGACAHTRQDRRLFDNDDARAFYQTLPNLRPLLPAKPESPAPPSAPVLSATASTTTAASADGTKDGDDDDGARDADEVVPLSAPSPLCTR
jgi:hypothetical protein